MHYKIVILYTQWFEFFFPFIYLESEGSKIKNITKSLHSKTLHNSFHCIYITLECLACWVFFLLCGKHVNHLTGFRVWNENRVTYTQASECIDRGKAAAARSRSWFTLWRRGKPKEEEQELVNQTYPSKED